MLRYNRSALYNRRRIRINGRNYFGRDVCKLFQRNTRRTFGIGNRAFFAYDNTFNSKTMQRLQVLTKKNVPRGAVERQRRGGFVFILLL